jgi:hypothetical protein
MLLPATPFERRMFLFSKLHQIPPAGSLEAVHLQKLMDMDVSFQLKLKALERRLPHLLNARLKSGSGLQMSKLLRSYFLEYFDRYFKYGPSYFPSSFNVVESFLHFDRQDSFFDLRDEREHLLSINDFFRWYEKGEIPKDASVLKDIMTEGLIYSYDTISGESSLRIAGDNQQVFAGVSLVRHDYELSCVLLAGECPPLTSDEDATKLFKESLGTVRKGLLPAPDLTTKDRYLDGFPSFAKVIVMTRFDVRARRHDVRYVNVDIGPAFMVFTDDFSVLGDLPALELQRLRKVALSRLPRYDNLFSALAVMIYLPAFFAAFPKPIHDLKVSTTLGVMREDKRVAEMISELGESQCPMERTIRCFPAVSEDEGASLQRIDPPEMKFRSKGYWRTIAPHEVGEGKNGERLFGRTWVTRHESWSARSPQSFMLERRTERPLGPDPGIVYVQRSPALEPDLYKVGFTRKSAEVRAEQLSSATGVPLPFGVLAKWSVADCARVEKLVHQKLAAFRINPRREFFQAELSVIIRTVDNAVKDLPQAGDPNQSASS